MSLGSNIEIPNASFLESSSSSFDISIFQDICFLNVQFLHALFSFLFRSSSLFTRQVYPKLTSALVHPRKFYLSFPSGTKPSNILCNCSLGPLQSLADKTNAKFSMLGFEKRYEVGLLTRLANKDDKFNITKLGILYDLGVESLRASKIW